MPNLRFLSLLSLLLLAACSALPSPQTRRDTADALAVPHHWQAERIHAGNFDLLAYRPGTIRPADTLTIYLEGDGFAWISRSMPSADPTPRTPLALRLALAHPVGNAAYLGRPCQYVDAERTSCPDRYWTSARFAPEVIESTNRAIDVLKTWFGARQLTLVGYSGGGAVAALVAARRSDVARLITVAGNLDHRTWTAHHRITTMSESLNAADVAERLAGLPQTHFVGGRDKVIPIDLARRWPRSFTGDGKSNLRIIDDADHACCWTERWPALLFDFGVQ